jgi:hypothetical protein
MRLIIESVKPAVRPLKGGVRTVAGMFMCFPREYSGIYAAVCQIVWQVCADIRFYERFCEYLFKNVNF